MLRKDLNTSYFKSKQVLVFCKNRNKKHTKTPLDKKTQRNRKSHFRMTIQINVFAQNDEKRTLWFWSACPFYRF